MGPTQTSIAMDMLLLEVHFLANFIFILFQLVIFKLCLGLKLNSRTLRL